MGFSGGTAFFAVTTTEGVAIPMIAKHPLEEWLQLPEGLAVAIFLAAGFLFLIALFGHKDVTIKEIKVGNVGSGMRVLAGIIGGVLFLVSILSFIQPGHPDEPEHSHHGSLEEVSPELDALTTESPGLDTSIAESPGLAAPITVSPTCDSTIPLPPVGRSLMFTWERVEGASTYTVEVDCFGFESSRVWYSQQFERPWHVRTAVGMRIPTYTSREVLALFRQSGGRAIRWRVWAVDHSGIDGAKSAWCQVAFSGSRRRIGRPGA